MRLYKALNLKLSNHAVDNDSTSPSGQKKGGFVKCVTSSVKYLVSVILGPASASSPLFLVGLYLVTAEQEAL